jgi:hypothetical protein
MRSNMKYAKYATALAVIAGTAAWVWVFVGCCEKPACRLIGMYTYRVDSLSEYIDYVAGADLYDKHRAASLVFSCDSLRHQLARVLHESMVAEALGENQQVRDEVVRLELLGARVEGKTLHMFNDVTVGEEELEVWAQQVHDLVESEPEDVRENWLPDVMKRLFHSVVLHTHERQIEIGLQGQYKCD